MVHLAVGQALDMAEQSGFQPGRKADGGLRREILRRDGADEADERQTDQWATKRLFVKFYGVQSVADVFVNGYHVGEHRGGFTAFTFEITGRVKFGAENRLLVVVSNTFQNDVL